MRAATSRPIVITRERWIHDRPTHAAPTPATTSVRSSSDAHGSSFALCVAMPAARYTEHGGDDHGRTHARAQRRRGQHGNQQEAAHQHVRRPALRGGDPGEQREADEHGEVEEERQPRPPRDGRTAIARPHRDPERGQRVADRHRGAGDLVVLRWNEQHSGRHEHDEHCAHRDLQPDPETGVLGGDGGDVRPQVAIRNVRCRGGSGHGDLRGDRVRRDCTTPHRQSLGSP